MAMTLMDLLAKLRMDKSDYDQGLKDAETQASGSSGKIGKLFTALGTATAAGLGASATAVGVLIKKSVSEYAEYEQLVGGVRKLYGDSAQELMSYAQQAYKTAGVSAGQYMEQATSFSAALINSLGGDTSAAAKQTDVAMRAISDNFNTFGGDIQNVQNAFQGFARGNFMMLDNLRLGYSGTKEGMQQLIDDANAYAAANGQAADLTIDSFSDIVTAIDLVQQKQGIAGTTANEAATTISGSIGMLKASWQDLVTGLTDSDADLGQLIGNVVTSAEAVAQNVTPAIKQALSGITQLIGQVGPILVEQVPALVSDLLPQLMTAATQLFVSLVQTLPGLIQSLFTAAQSIFSELVSQIPELWTQISAALDELFSNFGDMIEPLLEGLITIMEQVGTAVAENLPGILENILPRILEFAEMLNENAGTFIDAGINLILNLAQGLIDSLPTLISYVPQIITTILNILNENAPKILLMGAQLILMLAEGLIKSIPAIIENMGNIVEMIISIISAINWMNLGKEIITFIANGIKSLAAEAPNIMKGIFDKAVAFIKGIDWKGVGRSVLEFLGQGIQGIASSIPNILSSIFNAGVNALKAIDWLTLGKNIIQGIVNGIKALGSQIKEVLLGLASSAFEGVKDFFGIHSPSRKMRDEIGKFIPEGMALGIKDHADDVIRAMDDLEQIPDRYDPSVDFDGGSDYPRGRSGNKGGENNNGGNTYIINVNQQVSTPDEMAQAIRVESQYGLIEGVPI